MSLRRTWIVVLPIAALFVAGCGGGGGDDSSEATTTPTATTAVLTKDELLEQGNAICAEVNAAVGTVGSGAAEGDGSVAQAADLYSGMVASLKNVGVPQESAGYAEFSSAADELATAEDEVKLAAERGDTAGLESAETNASSALVAFQEAAEEYGFEDCSEGPSAPTTSPVPGAEPGESELGEEAEEAPEAVEPEAAEPEVVPEEAPETGGAGGGTGGGAVGAPEGGGETGGGDSGGIGPG